MTRYRTALFAGLAAVGLALAGCGGGSDDGLSQSEEQQLRDDAAAEAATLRARIMELEEALGLEPGDDVGDSVADLNKRIADLEADLKAKEDADAQAEADRMAAEAKRMAEEMAATAAKLYAGISTPLGTNVSPVVGNRSAAYNTGETAIEVLIGDGDGAPTLSSDGVTLSEDKDATVADNHGWTGRMYADPAGGDMVEAVVYSNVEAPKMGKKFGGAAANDEFEYPLVSGRLAVDTSSTAAYVSLVGGSSFDQSAGVKRFPLPKPNPNVESVVTVSGTFHGVPGTYSCTPSTAVCAANVFGKGFQLGTVVSATDATFTNGGGTWMFEPSDPNARVTESADDNYASYGWWIRKAANDGPFTASAFVDEKGTVAAASGLTALNGTATYQGGAAGKYALASSTGGTNDAGHFTAEAVLEADFTNNEITGTIDNFIGADGMPRDWSVELMESTIGDTGILNTTGQADGAPAETAWTIGGTAADDSGNWSGRLRNNGADGVPQVATGTFYSEHGRDGRMVGAFGANKQ